MTDDFLNSELFDTNSSDKPSILDNEVENSFTCEDVTSSCDCSEFNIDKELEELEDRVDGLDREKDITNSSAKSKLCATRHGCQGATNCNYDYASYPG